eukprot:6480864-Amphidinium_carterae.2
MPGCLGIGHSVPAWRPLNGWNEGESLQTCMSKPGWGSRQPHAGITCAGLFQQFGQPKHSVCPWRLTQKAGWKTIAETSSKPYEVKLFVQQQPPNRAATQEPSAEGAVPRNPPEQQESRSSYYLININIEVVYYIVDNMYTDTNY